jgi:hypothetical protein
MATVTVTRMATVTVTRMASVTVTRRTKGDEENGASNFEW